jgi:hypothetical protein
MTAQEADTLYLALSLLIPCAAVVLIQRAWIAISIASISHWLILDAAGRKLQELDPERDAGILDSLWLALGWIQGLILALILWGIKLSILFILSKK